MTPDQARRLLDGTTPGPWKWREGKDQNGEFVALRGPDGADALRTWDGDLYASGVDGTDADKALAAAAPVLAAMIAGMHTEYREEEWQGHYPGWVPTSPWTAEKPVGDPAPNTRVVRRYVTEQEEA